MGENAEPIRVKPLGFGPGVFLCCESRLKRLQLLPAIFSTDIRQQPWALSHMDWFYADLREWGDGDD
jgi:hypothetical protein